MYFDGRSQYVVVYVELFAGIRRKFGAKTKFLYPIIRHSIKSRLSYKDNYFILSQETSSSSKYGIKSNIKNFVLHEQHLHDWLLHNIAGERLNKFILKS